jgi:SAM-dependent methyltransferase
MAPIVRNHAEVLRATATFGGRKVLEVGCGDGRLLAWLVRQGSHPIGLDPSAAQLERARISAPGVPLVVGRGETLPMASGQIDLVLYLNSLHHVPLSAQWQAASEAARVLRPEGQLLVVEPLAEGEYFALLRPVDDETEIRREAYRVLQAAGAVGLRMVSELCYSLPVVEASSQSMRARFLAVDVTRAAALDRAMPELERLFASSGTPAEGGRAFLQPMRLNLLRRV